MTVELFYSKRRTFIELDYTRSVNRCTQAIDRYNELTSTR